MCEAIASACIVVALKIAIVRIWDDGQPYFSICDVSKKWRLHHQSRTKLQDCQEDQSAATLGLAYLLCCKSDFYLRLLMFISGGSHIYLNLIKFCTPIQLYRSLLEIELCVRVRWSCSRNACVLAGL